MVKRVHRVHREEGRSAPCEEECGLNPWSKLLVIKSTSLSPRPDRLTRILFVTGRYAANCMENAIACALSSAGMIPSDRESRKNAEIACSSSIAEKVARPVS